MKTSTLLHPIKVASQRSGLKPYVIRSWEARYGAIEPKRTGTNRRMYSDTEIERLRLLGLAVNNGHSISSVAGLGNKELARLVTDENDKGDTPSPHRQNDSDAISANGVNIRDLVASATDLVYQLDAPGLEQLLSKSAVMLTRHQFLQDLLLPAFRGVGDQWAAGELKVVHEHMLSTIVRSMLWDMMKSVVVADTAPKMVIATPSGHWHECGALISAVTVAESGWRAMYFGPSLPAEEIAYAVEKVNARALTLSIGHSINDVEFSSELKKIRRYLGPEVPIFIGGRGATAAPVEALNAFQTDDLLAFKNRLAAMCENDLAGG